MKKVAKEHIPKTVDEYLDALPEKERTVLTELRNTIKAAAPKAQEVISYHIPCYKYHGQLVCFAAYADHCSLFAINKNIIKTFAYELKPYKTLSSTIHFTVEMPLPAALVEKIVQKRVAENAGPAGTHAGD